VPNPNTPPEPPATIHPLRSAVTSLLSDLLSTLVFVALYAVTHSVTIAVGFAIALGLGQIAWLKFRGVHIAQMQWLSLFLVIVFGGTTLLTRNPVFVMVKPTFVYAAIGAVMLKSGWMNRYVPPIVRDHGADVTTTFGYLWAALMFATGAANLAVVWFASPAIWAWFIGTVPIASKIALVLIQYVTTRRIVRGRIRVSKALALSVP